VGSGFGGGEGGVGEEEVREIRGESRGGEGGAGKKEKRRGGGGGEEGGGGAG